MFQVKQLSDKLTKSIETKDQNNYVEITDPKSKKSCVLPQKYLFGYAEKIKKLEVYEDDVWVVTFPKCGTTWTQEMVWLISRDLDYETALKVSQFERFPYLELSGIQHSMDYYKPEAFNKMPRPRLIKSHLPVFLLPDKLWTVKPKIIYTARNPQDTAISYYHHSKGMLDYSGGMDNFLDGFLDDKVLFSPYADHLLDFWKLSQVHSNILYIFYEDMKADLDGVVKETMKFFDKDYSQEEIDKLCHHLSFESMKKNPTCNFEAVLKRLRSQRGTQDNDFEFMRKGKVGSGKEEMSEKYYNKFDALRSNPEFEKCGFAFK